MLGDSFQTSSFVIDKHTHKLEPKEAFEQMFRLSPQFAAGCIILADAVFLVCYADIICVNFQQNTSSSLKNRRQHKLPQASFVFMYVCSVCFFIKLYSFRCDVPA